MRLGDIEITGRAFARSHELTVASRQRVFRVAILYRQTLVIRRRHTLFVLVRLVEIAGEEVVSCHEAKMEVKANKRVF